jgi:hypothetical protein
MIIAVLDTGLFPDRETMEDTLSELEPFHNVYRCQATRADLTDQDWDRMLDEVMGSDLVITL